MTSLSDIVEDGDVRKSLEQDISDVSMLSVCDEVAQSDEVKSPGNNTSGGETCSNS